MTYASGGSNTVEGNGLIPGSPLILTTPASPNSLIGHVFTFSTANGRFEAVGITRRDASPVCEVQAQKLRAP